MKRTSQRQKEDAARDRFDRLRKSLQKKLATKEGVTEIAL